MFIDIIAIIVVLYGFYSGYSRGIIDAIFDIVSIIIALLAALKLSPIVIDVIGGISNLNPTVNLVIGFVVTFFLVMLLIRFIGKQLENVLKTVKINFINKLAGGVLLSGLFALLVAGLLWFGDQLNFISDNAKEQSVSYPVLIQLPDIAASLFQGLKPIFSEFWDKTKEAVDAVKASSESLTQ